MMKPTILYPVYRLFYTVDSYTSFSDSNNAPVKVLEADTLSSGKLLSLDAVLVSTEDM